MKSKKSTIPNHAKCLYLFVSFLTVFFSPCRSGWLNGSRAAAADCVSIPAGAVAWWRAESNYVDTIGTHDLRTGPDTSTNSFLPGKVGLAFSFASRRYLVAPVTDDLNLAQAPGLTMEGWIKPNLIAPNRPVIEWNDNKENIGAGLMVNAIGTNAPGFLEAYLTDTNARPTRRVILRSLPGTVTNSSWQHLALTFNRTSGTAAIYINGTSVASTNLGNFTPQTRAPIYFGFRPSGISSGNYFEGNMDEWAVYGRALEPDEILSIVLAADRGKCPPPPPVCVPVADGIVSWWRGQSNALDSVDSNDGNIRSRVDYLDGVVGKAFNNVSGVSIPASSNLNVGVGLGFTIELWVNPTYESLQNFLEWNNGTTNRGVSLGCAAAGTKLKVLQANLVDSEGRPHVIQSSGLLMVGVWQHVAFSYDKAAGLAKLYINGNTVAETRVGIFTPRTSGNIAFGGGLASAAAMDEISIYGRALSPRELQSIVLARAAGKCMQPPHIIQQPASQVVLPGTDVIFQVLAAGTPNLRYQWRFNDTAIPGATNTKLTLTNVQASQDGNYSVRITNAFNSIVSSGARLLVNRAPVARCQDIIISAGPDCHAMASINLSSFDPDGDQIILAQLPRGPYPLGTNLVTLEVADPFEFTDSCKAFVVVVDVEPPSIVCPPDIIVTNAHDAWTSILNYNPMASDNCGFAQFACTPPSGSAFGIGTHQVLCTATDSSQNLSQCSFTVTIRSGNIPPVPVIDIEPKAEFPGATNLIVISTNGQNATITLDGSRSYDTDDRNFYYFWYEGTNLFSTNVATTRILSPGEHEITLTLNDTFPLGTNSATVRIEVISPAAAVELIIDLVNSADLRTKNAEPLLAILKAAKASFSRGNVAAALNQLESFQNKVEAQIAPSYPALSEMLLRTVKIVIDAVGK